MTRGRSAAHEEAANVQPSVLRGRRTQHRVAGMPVPTPDLEIAPLDAAALQQRAVRWLDVRDSAERSAEGWVPGSRACSVEEAVPPVLDEPDRLVVVVCASGRRSRAHAELLRARGQARAVSLTGGIAAWRAAGLPVEGGTDQRFVRQVALPQVGVDGQRRLARARVLVVGVGGLGSPAISYLAGAGIGVLGLVDGDVVEASNLHRQPIHVERELGASKVASAARAIEARSPGVEVVPHPEFLTVANASRLLDDGWDVVLDCTDDIGARLALNDAAVRAGIPLVHGAVDRFEGRVAVLGCDGGPCYVCMHPATARAVTRTCAEAGVLGFAPGIVGTLQAGEALKVVLGMASPLRRGVLVCDLVAMTFQTIPLGPSPDCPVCAT